MSLADAGDGAALEKDYEAMVNAWLSGDLDRLENRPDSPFAEPAIRAAILTEPNRKWARAIGAMLRQGQKPFVAVGTAHLVGKDSLVDMLAAQGLTVERIQ